MPRMRGALRLLLPLARARSRWRCPASRRPPTSRRTKTLYYEGPSGRYLMDGTWLFRLDPATRASRSGWNRSASTAGWSDGEGAERRGTSGDDSPASMIGGVGWYRKDFSLPDASKALEWAVRFESVNYRSRVWLNGKPRGLQPRRLHPVRVPPQRPQAHAATNRLVIRVDSKRRSTDFPPSGLATNGTPTGGWWNYSGLQREVYLKRLDTVDWKSVRVIPRLACARCTGDRAGQGRSLRNVTRRRPARARHRQLRLAPASTSARAAISGNGVELVHDRVPDAATRACGRPRGPTSTTST